MDRTPPYRSIANAVLISKILSSEVFRMGIGELNELSGRVPDPDGKPMPKIDRREQILHNVKSN